MADLYGALWPLCLLLAIPAVGLLLAQVMTRRVQLALDRAIPDDLPHTAGDWLRGQLDADEQAALGVVVTDHARPESTNGYHPDAHVIQLDDHTYFKRDPLFWGVAAHELGHARLRRRHPVLGRLRDASRLATHVVRRLAMTLLMAHLLFAAPASIDPGLVCVALGLVVAAPHLLEEMAASWTAYRLTRATGMPPRYLRSIRLHLLAAFATYLADYLGQVALLIAWPMIMAGHPVGLFRGAGDLSVDAVAIVSALAVVHVGLQVRAWRAERTWKLPTPGSAWLLLGGALWSGVLLVTIASLSARVPAWATVLALTIATGGVLLVPSLVLAALYHLFRRTLVDAGEQPRIDDTAEFRRDRRAGAGLVMAGARRMAELRRASRAAWARWSWLGYLVELAYLPMLIVYWT